MLTIVLALSIAHSAVFLVTTLAYWMVMIGDIVGFVVNLRLNRSFKRANIRTEAELRTFVENAAERLGGSRWVHFKWRADVLWPVVVRWCTIPYLILLPFALVAIATFDWSGFDKGFAFVVRLVWGAILWRDYKKHRKNKRKLRERALSKIKEIGGKLVVVPQPALVGAR